MENKVKTSLTLSKTARQLLIELASQYGVSQSAMLEIIIREKSDKEKRKKRDAHTQDSVSP